MKVRFSLSLNVMNAAELRTKHKSGTQKTLRTRALLHMPTCLTVQWVDLWSTLRYRCTFIPSTPDFVHLAAKEVTMAILDKVCPMGSKQPTSMEELFELHASTQGCLRNVGQGCVKCEVLTSSGGASSAAARER